ncbi:uncharacterized protein DNG_05098 [Cephalotrichum gorgonifer]|uniref:Uncharacterized protein n=1 Tax=Cephalotrichum gorgonifer TaxID=2041049 RepID=A0AAE8N056_9PEZI|nr:uncharacterized protein DNG_05098 [Cephalotrichum gorgonifer]
MNRDYRIVRKLLGRGAPDSTTDSPPGAGSADVTSAPSIPPTYRSSVSQNAVYPASVPILCLDASPDKRVAILGGRHILKTINVDGLSIIEGVDVRAAISAQPVVAKGVASSLADQLSIKDVKWHGDSTIFTACSNGKIFSYDIARLGAGLEFVQTREDSRQVNTLDINPHRGSYLLSGSQDGLVRCFDIRAPQPSWTGGLTFRAVQAFKCNADGVRHVKWSPTDGMCFACGTESGVIMKWDIRKANSPLLRLAAHDKSCSSISWHPDGDHLMSAGWDSKCHVWNLSKSDKRQKPKATISTPAPVSTIAWRPGLWSATAQGNRVAQVAVSYDDSSQKRYGINAVHVWDLSRPTMPFKEIERFDSPPSSLLWKDQDLLWTAGGDGLFTQCDVAYAPRVVDRQSLSSFALSPRGDVIMFLDERPEALRPRPPPPVQKPSSVKRPIFGSSPTAPMLSISRSDSEEDVVGSFVGPRRRVNRSRQRRSSRSLPPNSNPSASSTPPSATIALKQPDLTLDQSLKVTGMFKTQQSMAFGHIPAATQVGNYHYLSASYLEILERELPSREPEGKPLVDRVGIVMEQFARTAESARLFRLAQSWRILAYVVKLLLVRRGQYHLEKRLGISPEKTKNVPAKLQGIDSSSLHVDLPGENTPRMASGSRSLAPEHRNRSVRSLLAEEIESTSNLATPVARPVENLVGSDHDFVPGKRLTPVLEPESFTLGPAAHPGLINSPRKRLDSEPISVESNGSGQTEESITDGYDFYDVGALARAIDVPVSRTQEVPPPPLSYGPQTPNSRPPGMRRDSEDSYGQMFSESGSTSTRMSVARGSLMGTSGLRTNRLTDIMEKRDEARGARSETTESEYESRIRGKEFEEPSPEKTHKNGVIRQPESPDEMFLISQTTMGTDPYSQESIPSQQDYHGANGNDSRRHHLSESEQHRQLMKPVRTEPAPLSREQSQVVTETDYLPWANDPPYPHPLASAREVTPLASGPTSPLDPYTTISRTLEYETRSSALHASAMILLLKPLVPDSVIDPFHAMSILRQHHARLMGMALFVEAAHLRNLCVKGWPEGLPTWGESYPSIFGPAQQNIKVSFFCASCRKSRDVDPRDKRAVWTCERCGARAAPCAVCGHRELEAEAEGELCGWWYCPACAHGGHASCLEAWHGEAEGCCPVDGCGHACLPGRCRAENGASRSEEVARHVVVERLEKRGSPAGTPVRGDRIQVAQSSAADSAREALGSGVPPARAGPGMGSPAGRGRERRKSVKFVGSGS